jgi:hypothetical protein
MNNSLRETFEANREKVQPGLRRDMDAHACKTSIWLAMYCAQLAGWSDLEGELFDLAFRVDCRIREQAAA